MANPAPVRAVTQYAKSFGGSTVWRVQKPEVYHFLLTWTEIHSQPKRPGLEACHHPMPKRLLGSSVVWMTPQNHAIHGLLQSEVFNICCTSSRYTQYVEHPGLDDWQRKWISQVAAQGGAQSRRNGWAPGHQEKCRIAMRKSWGRPILLTHPDGRREFFAVCADACRKYNLSKTALCNVLKGNRRHHKNYTAIYL